MNFSNLYRYGFNCEYSKPSKEELCQKVEALNDNLSEIENMPLSVELKALALDELRQKKARV